MALILDVARFKYPPHWVPLSLLWEAMDTIDEATGHHRGFMLISRLRRAPSLLYTLSCRHESWVRTAKYLIEDVPVLLKSDDIKSVQDILTVLFTSLPTNIGEFVKWVAEVRRQEEGGSTLSEEEKARLAVKEEVLKEVHETELYKCVTEWLSSPSSCCRNVSSLRDKDSLPEIAASVCCQGAELLTGMDGTARGFCCRATCVKCLKGDGDLPKTVVSGMVTSGGGEQGFEMLVPMSQTKLGSDCGCGPSCIGIHPASNDLLTALLLALPPQTWSSIKEEMLLAKIQGLVSTENLPPILQEEVLQLRWQLNFLKRCQDNKVDDDDLSLRTISLLSLGCCSAN